MTTKTHYTGDLKVGDLIAVSEGSSLQIGFFAGRGPTYTFQYWTLWSLSSWLDNGQASRFGPRGKNPVKSYHNNSYPMRSIKISPEFFDNETMIQYEKSVEALKILKVLL